MQFFGIFHQSLGKRCCCRAERCNTAYNSCIVTVFQYPSVYIKVGRIHGWISECQKYYVFSCIQQLLYFFCTAPVIFLQFFGILCHRHWNSNKLFFCQFRHCLNSNLVGNALFRFLSWYCNRIIFPDQTDGL